MTVPAFPAASAAGAVSAIDGVDGGDPIARPAAPLSNPPSGLFPEPVSRPCDASHPFSALRAALPPERPSPLRAAITAAYRLPEPQAVGWLRGQMPAGAVALPEIGVLADRLVRAVRAKRSRASGVDALMHEFSLSSEEGVALMCLAEALLRIPDAATADRLIADKLGKGDWRSHLGGSPSLFVNAATWGLVVTGKLVGTGSERSLGAALTRLLARGGEPLIRKAVDLAMRMLGRQFVTGQTIAEALAHSREREARGYRFSYDMLGEAALTAEDAERYCAAYEQAIHAIGEASDGRGIHAGPGISVKLSALHPRYVRAQRERVMTELLPRLQHLSLLAKRYDVGINIDAEEADRLELSLDLLEALACDPALEGFDGIGFVVQAYQKRCPFVIDYLADLARRSGRRFMVRLVKGAYWDTEIKRAQVDGLSDYPVYTRKQHTDMSYLVCARRLLEYADVLYPQFATHNAHSAAAILAWARERGVTAFEFQCLHGMGETLYDELVGMPLGTDEEGAEEEGAEGRGRRLSCRIYAPVGSYRTLLAYLVRRLLENGANSSFVNQIVDDAIPVAKLIADPFAESERFEGRPHSGIALPGRMFGAERANSAGLDLSDELVLRRLADELDRFAGQRWSAGPEHAAHAAPGLAPAVPLEVRNPADLRDIVGTVVEANEADVEAALEQAQAGFAQWRATPAKRRAAILERAAELFESHRVEFMALAVREAGRTLPNAVAEVREAVDFLRYYASRLRVMQDAPPLGSVACISPWNFPLAIFTGQVSAALAAGNAVLAKPAEQTALIACRAVQLLHAAGVPRAALQFLPGRGETVGARLTADPRVRAVIFTGSTDVARQINRTLARRCADEGREIPLIAETGGQNAMIVDSSALPEQVVQDVIASAFDSAGQRCSALRVLCLQEEVADDMLHMLRGAMRELQLGNPDRLSVDVGPVIDADAQRDLLEHIERLRAGREKGSNGFFRLPHPSGNGSGANEKAVNADAVSDAVTANGLFVAPVVAEIGSMAELEREVFGPVLHVLRYRRDELPQLLDAVHASGYGLTLGVHSRIDETIDFICRNARVGNIYVNRNIVGAVVGVQPFGGEGMSGTGPKAGGPLYLHRLRQESPQAGGVLAGLNPSADTPETGAVPPAGRRSPLEALRIWAGTHGYAAFDSLANGYVQASLTGTKLSLSGPTGEANRLAFAPRGTVLCIAADAAVLLNQLAAALACGNAIAIDAGTADVLPDDFPPVLRRAVRTIDNPYDGVEAIDIVLADQSLAARVRLRLAERDGAIVQVIATSASDAIPVWRLVAERAVCVNTAAAGGNASLMTLEE